MTTQHYVEHFASEMEKLRALDDKNQAKAIAYITEDECMAAIRAMALPCPFCGSANLYFYLQARSCLVICGACGAQKPGCAGMAVFAPESREWQMQNLADAVNAWNQRAELAERQRDEWLAAAMQLQARFASAACQECGGSSIAGVLPADGGAVHYEPCTRCGGLGSIGVRRPAKCRHCGGTGKEPA